jgi:hypothetical protein
MTWLSRHRLLSLLIVLAVPGLATAMMALPEEDEKKISISKLPKSIQKALTGVDVDNIELTTVYEIGIEEDGVEIELRLDGEGRLLGIELELELESEDDKDEKDDDKDDDEE